MRLFSFRTAKHGVIALDWWWPEAGPVFWVGGRGEVEGVGDEQRMAEIVTNWTRPRQALPRPYLEVEGMCMDGKTRHVFFCNEGWWRDKWIVSCGDPEFVLFDVQEVEVDVWRDREW